MWTPNTREQHSRKALRYQCDLTDAEWADCASFTSGLPQGAPVCLADVRIINCIFCVMRAGYPWRLLPSDPSSPNFRSRTGRASALSNRLNFSSRGRNPWLPMRRARKLCA
jgi:transposase